MALAALPVLVVSGVMVALAIDHIDYLYSLIDQAGLSKKTSPYGQATRDGLTVDYFVLRLSVQDDEDLARASTCS